MLNKEKNFISAVVYVHNAEESISLFLKNIIGALEENFEYSELICVNDHSNDQSVARIKEIAKACTSCNVSVVNLSYFHGLEMAMSAGINLAIGDFVYEFDNTNPDFDAQILIDVYRCSLQGYDIVSAAPNRKEKASSALFYRLFSHYAGLSQKITTESFRILSRRVINRIESMNRTIPYRKVIYANCGLKTNIIRYEAKEGHRSNRFAKTEKAYRKTLAVDSLMLFTDIGYKFSISMTILMMLISVFVLLYTVITYLSSNPTEGWTTTVLFLSVAFFGLFALLTIVIKYLKLLLDLIFKRKHYSFESIEKLNNK